MKLIVKISSLITAALMIGCITTTMPKKAPVVVPESVAVSAKVDDVKVGEVVWVTPSTIIIDSDRRAAADPYGIAWSARTDDACVRLERVEAGFEVKVRESDAKFTPIHEYKTPMTVLVPVVKMTVVSDDEEL